MFLDMVLSLHWDNDRTFLGSVSGYLAHHSPCPLIVVKQKKNGNVDEDDKALHKHFL